MYIAGAGGMKMGTKGAEKRRVVMRGRWEKRQRHWNRISMDSILWREGESIEEGGRRKTDRGRQKGGRKNDGGPGRDGKGWKEDRAE